MIWNAFLLAVRQIWRNPMRSLLTVLGVVIGVAAVITMVTIGNGASEAIRSEIESFGNNQLMLRPAGCKRPQLADRHYGNDVELLHDRQPHLCGRA